MTRFRKLIKDMNNIKIANLANPTDNEDATNKKYVDEKTETIDFFPFLSKYAGRSLFIETFIKKSNMLVSHRLQLKQWNTSSK